MIKVSAGFYYCRLFLYRLIFLPNIINADLFTDIMYLIPFKFRLPLFFTSRGAKIGGSEFKPRKIGGVRNKMEVNLGILY